MSIKKNNENLIYLIIWLMVFSLPILTLRNDSDFNWSRLILEWTKISPFLLIFFINNFLLVPRFLFKNKNYQYIAIVTVVIFIISGFFDLSKYIQHFPSQASPPPFDIPPPFGDGQMPRPMQAHEPIAPLFSLGARMVDMIVFSYLVVGFNCAVKFVFKRQSEEKDFEIQRNIHLQTELSFLKNQVSPHFFMNTLNNIHSLIDYDTEIAKESVITLSKLMRHILYDSQNDKILLKKEMDFIRNYVELMKLRNSDKVRINLNIPDNLPDKMIPLLLFISYIENAFKHGISFQIDSYIDINFEITTDQLIFNIKNSNTARLNKDGHIGIGIDNSRKRLDLIYGNKYTLNIEHNAKEFYVNIILPI